MRNIGRLYQGWVIFLALFFVALAILMGVMTVVAHAEEEKGYIKSKLTRFKQLELTRYSTDFDKFCEDEPERKYCLERAEAVRHED